MLLSILPPLPGWLTRGVRDAAIAAAAYLALMAMFGAVALLHWLGG